jgi:hypothetical protein
MGERRAGGASRRAVDAGGCGRAVDRRKRVLNFSEVAVDRMLAEYAAENGYRISLKMRLRDVIDVDDLPLDRRARNFAFTSHLERTLQQTSATDGSGTA